MEILGIDIGGSGIKGAIVETNTGEFITERLRIETPQPATPPAVTDTVAEIVKHFEWKGVVGCTFPAIIRNGVAYSAANVHDDFVGVDVCRLIQRKTGIPVLVMNDADAAGVAEMHFGAGRGNLGTVIVLTLGTGIGSAIFRKGVLVPNTELGHVYLKPKKKAVEGENYAANSVRKDEDLSYKKWGKRVDEYLQHVEFIFSPDLIIIGGGVSKKHEKFFEHLESSAPIVPAQLRNRAGIIGAAIAAQDLV